MDNPQFFQAFHLSDRLIRIKGLSEEMMYLVVGDDKAALIDTGIGVGDLRRYVRTLTEMPLIVLITHAHVDHAMGASGFDEVYLSPDDQVIYEDHRRSDKRHVYLKRFLGKRYELVTPETYIDAPAMDFRPMLPGDIFDLGGIHLEIFGVPGHSPGSVAVLIREERRLLLGDACSTLTILFDRHSPTIETYRNTLLRLQKDTRGRFDEVLLSHAPGSTPVNLIASVIAVCDDILNDHVDEIPFRFMEYNLVAARRLNAALMRSDGGVGNIVYDKSRIHNPVS